MPFYARIVSVKAHLGRERDVHANLREATQWLTNQPGYVLSMDFHSMEDPSVQAGLVIWTDKPSADRAINNPRGLELTSALLRMADEQPISPGLYEARSDRPEIFELSER